MHPEAQKLIIARAEREIKYFRAYTNFRPNPKVAPITPKFYSKHEAFDENLVREEYLELLKREEQTPKEKYDYPVTENQRYGWYLEPLIDNIKDFRINFKTTVSPDIKLACEMQRLTKQMRSVVKSEKKK